jgi:hypothetical protein
MRKSLVLLAGAGLLLPVMRMKDEQNAKPAEEILRSYAADFRHDPAATKPLTFGVRVAGAGGGDWHVAVTGGSEGATQSDVALKPGFPTEPCAYFQLDLATLRRIDRGELNLLTAVGGRPREGAAPLVQLGATPRFQLDEDYLARLRPYMFHFWTRGAPERVPFRGELTQLAHGANAVVFYYQEGFLVSAQQGPAYQQGPG